MKVHAVMSHGITTVLPETGFKEVWQLINKHKINAVPVVDKEKKLIGIVTKEDLLKLLYPDYQEFLEDFASGGDFEEMERRIAELASKKAADVMSSRVIFARYETPIMRALSRMIVRGVDQLPVLSDEDTVIGVITKGDIFRSLFAQHLDQNKTVPAVVVQEQTSVVVKKSASVRSSKAIKKIKRRANRK